MIDFAAADRILESVPVRVSGDSGDVRIEALTRIALALFGYGSAAPGPGTAGGLKYYLYLQDRLLEGICLTVCDGRVSREVRIAAACEYFRIRYESGAVWNTDDGRLARTESAVRELLDACAGAERGIRDAGDFATDAELLQYCGLLRLLTLHARYAPEVPMAWKELLDAQVSAWYAGFGAGDCGRGLTAGRALMRLDVLAKYRSAFPASYDLGPVRAACLPAAMERIPAAGDCREIAVLYDVLSAGIDAPADLADIWRLRDALAVRQERGSRFTADTAPAAIADARLLVRSICIEIDCRRQELDTIV